MTKSKAIVKYIIIFLIMFVSFSSISLVISAVNPDDYWNFHFIQKIYNGYIPYSDFNFIITPLFHYIGVLFMLIFGNHFYIMPIYAGFISSILFILGSKLISIHTKTYKSRFAALSLYIILLLAAASGANYNAFMLIFPLATLILEDKISDKTEKKYRIIQGALLGLMVLTKHTIGAVFSLAYFIYLFITKEKEKKYQTVFYALLAEIAIGLIFVVYLVLNNNFLSFFNLCIGGIFDFGSKNAFASEDILPLFFLVILELPLVFNYKNRGSKKDILYFGFFFASLFILYPLANAAHIFTAAIPISIITIYSLHNFFADIILTKPAEFVINLAYAIIIVCFLITLYCYVYKFAFYKPYKLAKEYDVFDYCPFADDFFISDLRMIHMFMDEKEAQGYHVYILSSNASLYSISRNQNNGYFDLLLNGNLGYNGVNNIIEKISKIKNPLFLKADLGEINFQEPKEIENYIVNNYKYTGENFGEMRVFVSK